MTKMKKIMLPIVLSLLIAILFSGPALSAPVPTPDAAHSISTDKHGCWFNPEEKSEGHYDEENGYWIVLKV